MRDHSLTALAETVADTAIIRCLERSSPSDTVNAIGNSLGYLHSLISAEVGYAAQREFEERLREHLSARALRRNDRDGETAPLPHAEDWSGKAEAIMRDAAQSAVVLNAWGDGHDVVHAAAIQMIDGMVALLDGVPAWDELVHAYLEIEPGSAPRAGEGIQTYRLQ